MMRLAGQKPIASPQRLKEIGAEPEFFRNGDQHHGKCPCDRECDERAAPERQSMYVHAAQHDHAEANTARQQHAGGNTLQCATAQRQTDRHEVAVDATRFVPGEQPRRDQRYEEILPLPEGGRAGRQRFAHVRPAEDRYRRRIQKIWQCEEGEQEIEKRAPVRPQQLVRPDEDVCDGGHVACASSANATADRS